MCIVVIVFVTQEFFRELTIRSAQKASTVCAGTRILQLTDSETLRRRLAQIEKGWINLNDMMPTLHQTQQQVQHLSLHLFLRTFIYFCCVNIFLTSC